MNFDWSRIFNYIWNLALLGGSAYLSIAQPQLMPVVAPFLQAAGQLGPQPAGVSIFKQPSA